MVIERINLVEQMEFTKMKQQTIKEEDYDLAKFAKDGLVLAMHESSFPHQISFMLIEPCSHIQWEYAYFDDKVNVIESRRQRRNFIANIQTALSDGILRDLGEDRSEVIHKIGP